MEETDRQVQVRFTTRLPKDLRVDTAALSLPVYLNRYGLSQIINTLLGLEETRPFDFLFDGELIRTTLEQLYISKNISAESVLVLEYVLAVGPPEEQTSIPDKDWVRAVNGSHPSFIFSGSYDNLARAWSADGSCRAIFEGHSGVITSLVVIGSTENEVSVITSSKDKTLRFWEVPTTGGPTTVKSSKVFKGHNASVQCIAASPSGSQMCSGSWDQTIKLWKISPEDEDHDRASKMRRMEGDDKRPAYMQVSSFATYKEHSQCVSGLEWPEEDSIFSVSWDHTVRQWNTETNANTVTMTCNQALHCISVGGEGSSLIAAGGADQILRIWDPRVSGTVTTSLQFSSHKGWITACKWHRESTKHLLTASHDGTVKIWDMRSKVPLQTVEAHEDKVLCADWWKNDNFVSGGADSKLKVFRYMNVFQQ